MTITEHVAGGIAIVVVVWLLARYIKKEWDKAHHQDDENYSEFGTTVPDKQVEEVSAEEVLIEEPRMLEIRLTPINQTEGYTGFADFIKAANEERDRIVEEEQSTVKVLPHGEDLANIVESVKVHVQKGLQESDEKRKFKHPLSEEGALDALKQALTKGIESRSKRPKSTKLTWNQVSEIKYLLKTGIAHSVLAKKYGVAKSTITSISTGKTWKDV